MNKGIKQLNDLELLDYFCENCLEFINPIVFRELTNRGLVWVANRLPKNTLEAKAIVRSRLAKVGKSFGDEEIDQIANEISRLETLRGQLNKMNMADAHKVIPVLQEMQDISEFVLQYFKPVKIT